MAPKNEEQYQKIRQKRKEKILEVALQLFANQGYHRTSISDIATKAKISKGLLYNYFKNKKDLLLQVSIYSLEATADEIFSILKNPSNHLSPPEKVKQGIDLYFDMLIKQADLWKLSMSLALQIADMPEINLLMNKAFQQFFSEIEEILQKMNIPDASGKAKLLAAQLDGIALHYFALGKEYDLKEIKQALLETLHLK